MKNIAAIKFWPFPLRWIALLLCLACLMAGRVNAADAAADVPKVTITATPKFIVDPKITIKGRATFSGGIKWTWYDWYDNDNRVKGSGWLTTPQATEVLLEKDISLDVDGMHWFRFYAVAEDGQEVWADWTTSILDTTAPKIADRTQAKDNVIEADTVLRINVTDQDPSGGNDASGIAVVTMQVTDQNNKQYAIDLVRQEQGMVRKEDRIHAADYTAALGNIFAQLPEGVVTINFSTRDKLGNEDKSQALIYIKAGPPVASVTVPAQATNQTQISLGIEADGDVGIKKIWLDSWMIKGGKRIDFPRADIAFPKSKNVKFDHPYAFPNGEGKYFFKIAVEDDKGRQADLAAQEAISVIHDTTAAEVSEISPVDGSKVGYGIDMQFRVDDKDGSGINDVQIQLCRGDSHCGGWYTDIGNDGDGLYKQWLRSRDFGDGELTAQIWIKDNAGNITWKYVKYEKNTPAKNIVYLNLGESRQSRTLPFMASRTDELPVSMRFDVWKEGEPDAKQSVLLESSAGEQVKGWITVPDDGIYYWSATIVPDNEVVTSGRRIAISSKDPVLFVESMEPGAVDEGVFEMTVKAKSVVEIVDAQLQFCQNRRCGNWINDMKNKGKNDKGQTLFSSDISVEHFAGSYLVKIWAKDEAGRTTEGHLTYYRNVAADAALSVSLEQGIAGAPDSLKGVRITRDGKINYRITLINDRYVIEGASLRYRLPGGLRPDGIARLVEGDAGVVLNAGWNGDTDDELLGVGTELKPAARMVIEVPVVLKDAAVDSSMLKSTVYAGAKNLVGTVDAMHHFRLADRLMKKGHRVDIVKSVDGDAVAQPGAPIRYQIRVSNHTFKTVRNLLIRDRAPEHTTLIDASCGNLPSSECKTVTLSDKAVEDGSMTYAALCKGGGAKSDPQGRHVFWCLNGDLEPLANYIVDYSVRIDDGAAAAP